MQNEEQKENTLEKLYEQLPENVQEAISSVAVAEKLQEIAKRNGLHIDEAGIVSDEATMVMLGIENPKDFVDSLQNKLKLPREKVVELAKDVNKEIFEPIRESLRKMYEDEEDLVADESRLNADERRLDTDTISLGLGYGAGKSQISNLKNEVVIPTNDDGSVRKELPAETSIMTPDELNQKLTEEDSIFKAKMGGVVSLPKEEITIEQNNSPKIESKIRHIDPYKEPTE